MNVDADVMIVGGGIAGLCAADAAVRAGRHATIVDDGIHRASDVPIALVNPLRGHAGRLVPRGVEGMVATFDLIERLRAAGHAIASGRGLHRPLVDLHGERLSEAYWRARIADRLDFAFIDATPPGLGLVDRPPALVLPQAGWVAAPDLLAALRANPGIASIVGRAQTVTRDAVRLVDGTSLRARAVLWCGGAWGAHGLDQTATAGRATGLADPGESAIYKPGSLATTTGRLTAAPLTFGLYAVPFEDDAGSHTLIGPTREEATATFPATGSGDSADDDGIARLQDRVRRLFGANIVLVPAWRGVRLARLSAVAREALRDVATLTALGSRGFLMAPLLANEWAASL